MSDGSFVTGLSDFRRGIVEGIDRQRQLIREKLAEMGVQITAEIRLGAPRKTGALAGSVRYVIFDTNAGQKLEVFVGDEVVYYAPHVEFGTSEAPAHPFVRPVAHRHEKAAPKAIEESIVKVWEK